MTTAAQIDRALRRWLSVHPRLRSVALAVRRRLRPLAGAASARRHWDLLVGAVDSGEHAGWLDCPLIEREYIRPQVSGDPEVDYLSHFVSTHLARRPVERGLSLGCGGGAVERALIQVDAATVMDGLDVSPSSIELARRRAAEAGMDSRLCYRVEDIDGLSLPPRRYGFAVAKMALHHLTDLEHVFAEVAGALAPGAPLMFNEFVGPSRFQWSDRQVDLMNEMLARMPPRIRRAAPFARVHRPDARDVAARDPSESVRSAEILPLLRRHFDLVELAPYGGTLLHVVLSPVIHAFDLEAESDRELLRSLIEMERSLIARGELESDFAYGVALAR